MNRELYDVLESCLKAMQEGVSLEECLERYPRLANKLRPALEAANIAQCEKEAAVPEEAINRSQRRLLVRAAKIRAEKQPRRAWLGLSRLAVSLMLAILLLVMTSGSLFAVSAKSLPGDKLYPVKRAVENLQVQLAPGVEHKSEAETKFRLQRIGEVRQLLEMRLNRNISFEGIVERISEAQWMVSGIEVHLSDDTVIIGNISEGMLVEIEGLTETEGFVAAREIHLREFQVSGSVEKISQQEWMISGMRVSITSETQLSPLITEGDDVLALLRSEDDQSWIALAILKLGNDTAASTPKPTYTSTATPEATDAESMEPTEEETANEDVYGQGSEDETSITGTPEPDDHSGSGEEESTPEPKKTEDESGSGNEGSTPEPEKTESDHESGGGESTPEPTKADEHEDATSEPEESEVPEVTPTPGG